MPFSKLIVVFRTDLGTSFLHIGQIPFCIARRWVGHFDTMLPRKTIYTMVQAASQTAMFSCQAQHCTPLSKIS